MTDSHDGNSKKKKAPRKGAAEQEDDAGTTQLSQKKSHVGNASKTTAPKKHVPKKKPLSTKRLVPKTSKKQSTIDNSPGPPSPIKKAMTLPPKHPSASPIAKRSASSPAPQTPSGRAKSTLRGSSASGKKKSPSMRAGMTGVAPPRPSLGASNRAGSDRARSPSPSPGASRSNRRISGTGLTSASPITSKKKPASKRRMSTGKEAITSTSTPSTTAIMAAPSRPQNLKVLPGGESNTLPPPPPPTPPPLPPRKGQMQQQRAVLSSAAIFNRSLPPPPKSRSIFSRGSSHHGQRRQSSYGMTASTASDVDDLDIADDDDDDDDYDEFAEDTVAQEDDPENVNRRNSSILRNSNLRRGGSKRVGVDGSISVSRHSSMGTIGGMSSGETVPLTNSSSHSKDIVRPSGRRGMKKPGLGLNDTEHSMRAWTQSFKWGGGKKNTAGEGGDRRAALSKDYAANSASRSTRSVLTVDMEWEEDPLWTQLLRYIRILPPHADEKPIKRKIRILTWMCLLLDFLTGIVSITTYDGVTYCCGEPILSIAGNFNWNVAIRVTVWLYMVMIFAEILPVMRETFPFNLANPFVGFLITFAMFFDDRILEAVIMWIIEATAVLCEFWVYRLKVQWHSQRGERLKQTEVALEKIRKARKRRKLSTSTHSTGSNLSSGGGSDVSSIGDASFHDESEMNDAESCMAATINTTGTRQNDVSQIRETRLLRERRLLRQAQKEDRRHLKFHFAGVAFNIGLVCISLLMVIMIGRSGGLCIVDMIPPNIFKTGQLEKCFDCKGVNGVCEVCRDDGTSHCYYPYY